MDYLQQLRNEKERFYSFKFPLRMKESDLRLYLDHFSKSCYKWSNFKVDDIVFFEQESESLNNLIITHINYNSNIITFDYQ